MNKLKLLSDFRNLNGKTKCNTYPAPKVNDMLLILEGFKYDTYIDLNMR